MRLLTYIGGDIVAVCKEYLCKIGERKDFMFLCNDCIQIQQKVGEVKEFGEVKEAK